LRTHLLSRVGSSGGQEKTTRGNVRAEELGYDEARRTKPVVASTGGAQKVKWAKKKKWMGTEVVRLPGKNEGIYDNLAVVRVTPLSPPF
jgi:hypothetical protein